MCKDILSIRGRDYFFPSHYFHSQPGLRLLQGMETLPCMRLSQFTSMEVQKDAAEQRYSPVIGKPIEVNGRRHACVVTSLFPVTVRWVKPLNQAKQVQ